MTGHHSHDFLYGILLLAGFLVVIALMLWDVGRQCEKAQHEVELDALWDEDDEIESVA